MLQFFVFFTLVKSIDICWRTNTTLGECDEPFDKEIQNEDELAEYSGESLFLELISSEQYPAHLDKYGYMFTDVTVMGHNSYLMYNFTGLDKMKSLKLSDLDGFCIVDHDLQNPVTFETLEISKCQIIGDHFDLTVDKFVTDLDGALAFQSVTVTQSIILDLNQSTQPTENVENLIIELGSLENSKRHSSLHNLKEETKGTAEIKSIPDRARITSDEVNAYLTTEIVTIELHNPSKWDLNFDVTEENTVVLQQPDDQMASKIIINLDEYAKLELESYPEETDNEFAKVIAKGNRNEIIFGENATIDIQAIDNCFVATESAEIHINSLILTETSQFIFDNEQQTTKTLAYIESITLDQDSLIAASNDVDLYTREIQVQNSDMTEPVIDKQCNIMGYPDFEIINSNAIFGSMAASNTQRFQFTTDFKHINGIEFSQMTKESNNKLAFSITLNIEEEPSDDVLRPLIGKTLPLITIDETTNPSLLEKGFCPKERFEINSQFDGFSDDNSVIEPICNQTEDQKAIFGYTITKLPSVSNIQVCIDAETSNNCPTDEAVKYLTSFDSIRDYVTEQTNHVRVYVTSDQSFTLSSKMTHSQDIQITIESYAKGGVKEIPTVHMQVSNELLESHISHLTFDNVIADFKSQSMIEMTIPKITFKRSSELTSESLNAVSFKAPTTVEIGLPLISQDQFKLIQNVHYLIDDDTSLEFQDDSIIFADTETEASVKYSDFSNKKLNLTVLNGNQLALINNSVKSNIANIIDITAKNIMFYFFNFSQTVATLTATGDIEIDSSDFVPIKFSEDIATNLLFKGEDLSTVSKQTFVNANLQILKDSASDVLFTDLSLMNTHFNGDNDMINSNELVQIEKATIPKYSTSSISHAIINNNIEMNEFSDLTFDNVLFSEEKNTKIQGIFSLMTNSSKIRFTGTSNAYPLPKSIVYTFMFQDEFFNQQEGDTFNYSEPIIFGENDKTNFLDVFSYAEFEQPKNFRVNISIVSENNGVTVYVSGEKIKENNDNNNTLIVVICVFAVLTVLGIIAAFILYYLKKQKGFKGVDSAYLVFESSNDEITRMV